MNHETMLVISVKSQSLLKVMNFSCLCRPLCLLGPISTTRGTTKGDSNSRDKNFEGRPRAEVQKQRWHQSSSACAHSLRIDEDIVIAGGHKYQELDRFITRLRWARHRRQARCGRLRHATREDKGGGYCFT